MRKCEKTERNALLLLQKGLLVIGFVCYFRSNESRPLNGDYRKKGTSQTRQPNPKVPLHLTTIGKLTSCLETLTSFVHVRCFAILCLFFILNSYSIHFLYLFSYSIFRWDVPLTWITSTDSSAKSQKWLGQDEPFVLVNAQSGTEWLKFNVGQYGFYRVNYPEAEWNNFAELLMNNHEVLSTKDRAHLLNDAFSLAESGHVPYSIPLAMTKYLKKEQSLIPWESAYDKIVTMGQLLIDTPTYPLFRKVINWLIKVVLQNSIFVMFSVRIKLGERSLRSSTVD